MRNAHQEFAKIFPAQETDEGPRPFPSPSTTSSRYLIRPSRPRRNIVHEIPITPDKVGDNKTAKRRPLFYTVRIKCGRRMGPGDSEVALYMEISPQTGMRANGLSSGNTASNTVPPTFSK